MAVALFFMSTSFACCPEKTEKKQIRDRTSKKSKESGKDSREKLRLNYHVNSPNFHLSVLVI